MGSREGGISWHSREVPLALVSRTGQQLLASPVPLPGGEDSACQPASKRLLRPCAVNGEPVQPDGQGRGQPARGAPAPLQPMQGSHPSLTVSVPSHVPLAECQLSVSVSCGVRLCQGSRSVEPGNLRSHLAEGHGASDVAKRALKGGDTWPSCQPFTPFLRQGSR